MITAKSKIYKVIATSFAGITCLLTSLSAQVIDSSFANFSTHNTNQSITFTSGAVSSSNPAVTIGGTDNDITVEGTADLSSGAFQMSGHTNGNTLSITGGILGQLQLNSGLDTTTISGGEIASIALGNKAGVTVNGGKILGNLQATGSSSAATINSGIFLGDVNVSNNSTLDILGGSFDPNSTLSVVGSSVVNIAGSNFLLDGEIIPLDFIPSTNAGLLTGTLADNSSFEMSVDVNNGGVINLTAVPEPSTVAAIIAAAGLLLISNRKRKRAVIV
ncbi:PEP-CTERM sorting domain-containing protein [Puniceicoccaceae bacterium K14]|nr:PEP-CTERM sorting domain-containing protein [Puniceicoccaceae bacterium K14]